MSHSWNAFFLLLCWKILSWKSKVMGKCMPLVSQRLTKRSGGTLVSFLARRVSQKTGRETCMSCFLREVSRFSRCRKASRVNLEHCSIYFFFWQVNSLPSSRFSNLLDPIQFDSFLFSYSFPYFYFFSFPFFSTRIFRYRNCDLYDEIAKIKWLGFAQYTKFRKFNAAKIEKLFISCHEKSHSAWLLTGKQVK